MNVLLSIKPEYVEKIQKGIKRYEFRKLRFRPIKDSEKVFIYSSSPVKRIIGSFRIEEVVEDHPAKLWEQFKEKAGIGEKEFFKYFENEENGLAISIEKLEVFKKPVDPKKIEENFVPPQAFKYIDEGFLNKILELSLEDMYDSGYSIRMYRILEDDFIDFLNYIPAEYYSYNERKKICSPILSDLMIRIGSQIDIFFKNWDLVQKLNPKIKAENLKIMNYKIIENDEIKRISLKDKEIIFLPTEEVTIPFKNWNNWKKYDENWWNAYNHIKHNGYKFKEEGNLQNVIESLSALFLLNCLHEKVKFKLIEYKYIETDSALREQIDVRQNLDLKGYRAESKLFEYEYLLPQILGFDHSE